MAGQVEDFTPGGVFQGSNINFTAASSSSSSSSSGTDTFIQNININNTNNTITFSYNDASNRDAITINLSDFNIGGGGGSDDDKFVNGGNLTGDDMLVLNFNDGTNLSIDLSALAEGGTDTNDYVDSISLDADDNDLRLGYSNSEISDITVSLDRFVNVDNQATGTPQFTQGDYTYTIQGDVLTVTDASAPSPSFDPEEADPDPVNALEANEVVFDAPEANEGFVIASDGVEVTDIAIKDTDGNNISTDETLASVNTDNSITVDLTNPAIDNMAIGEIDLTVEITDTDGNTATVEPQANLFVPYYTLSSNTDFTDVSTFQDAAIESTEELGSTVTIAGVGNGRKKYWVMTNGMHTFMQQGFMLEATVVTTAKIEQYTYTLYDLGEFGNPFDSSVASPDITLDVS